MLRMTRRFMRGAVVGLMLASAPIYSAAAEETSSFEIGSSSLDPGKFVWNPGAGGSGAVRVLVSLGDQMAYVFRGDTLIGASTISSGKPGKDTPVGTFEILQKNKDHRSNIYDNAPMPYMQRLTWDGIALHGGAIPGYPASHGCVRLPTSFAKKLFGVTKLGATVVVTDFAPYSMQDALSLASGTTEQAVDYASSGY